jgi:quercetin dioxygenase-like cupin family protein
MLRAIQKAGGEDMQIHSWKDKSWDKVTDKISRKIISGENVMISHISLTKGAVVPLHSHVSEQISYVLDGALKVWINNDELVVESGQVLVIPPNVPHRVIALEDTLDIDIFSPIRKDWLDHTDDYFRRPEGET